ncbi:MAG TPA: hypothetical protein VNT57_06740, partial [Desulfobacteria bacterium]|nr:hypothetical protein [Desulfobacteria bacterium]
KPGGVLYIDYEVSPSYWNNTKDFNLYLEELISRFDRDYIFNFSVEQSSLLNRYYRRLIEVISLRDWKKLIKGILKRVVPALNSQKPTGSVFASEKYSIDWEKAVQKLSLECDILTRENYLACRESELPPAIWEKWNSKLSDSFYIIARKRN